MVEEAHEIVEVGIEKASVLSYFSGNFCQLARLQELRQEINEGPESNKSEVQRKYPKGTPVQESVVEISESRLLGFVVEQDARDQITGYHVECL